MQTNHNNSSSLSEAEGAAPHRRCAALRAGRQKAERIRVLHSLQSEGQGRPGSNPGTGCRETRVKPPPGL